MSKPPKLEVDRAALEAFLLENSDRVFDATGSWCRSCPFALFVQEKMNKPTFAVGYTYGTEDGTTPALRYELPSWVSKFIERVDNLEYGNRLGANALEILRSLPHDAH